MLQMNQGFRISVFVSKLSNMELVGIAVLLTAISFLRNKGVDVLNMFGLLILLGLTAVGLVPMI